MGSSSDSKIMKGAAKILDEFKIKHEDQIVSAHRTPTRLADMGRMLKIFVMLTDKPGALKELVDVISSLSFNIVEVLHDRLSSNVSAGTAGVTLSLETEDQKHAEKLIEHLKKRNIQFKILT